MRSWAPSLARTLLRTARTPDAAVQIFKDIFDKADPVQADHLARIKAAIFQLKLTDIGDALFSMVYGLS